MHYNTYITHTFITYAGPDAAKKITSRRTSTESQQIGGEFADFLKRLNKTDVTRDVSKQVTKAELLLAVLNTPHCNSYSMFFEPLCVKAPRTVFAKGRVV